MVGVELWLHIFSQMFLTFLDLGARKSPLSLPRPGSPFQLLSRGPAQGKRCVEAATVVAM